MKRIDYIVRGVKGVLKDTFNFREKKVIRTVEDAIDYADEQTFEMERQAVEIINSIKDVADNKDKIIEKLNQYIDVMEKVEGYKRSKAHLEKVQELFNEEIEIEVEDEKK